MKDANGQRACGECGSPLVNGETGALDAASKNFTVRVENIPVQKCPRGHAGLYWRDKKFGPNFTDGLDASGIMAKGRRTLTLRFRHVCPSCGEEMDGQRAPREFTFEFSTELARTRPYRVTMTAPALFCGRCSRHYMPYDRGIYDAYYLELHDLLSSVIKKRFR